jgi:hypothetical protein
MNGPCVGTFADLALPKSDAITSRSTPTPHERIRHTTAMKFFKRKLKEDKHQQKLLGGPETAKSSPGASKGRQTSETPKTPRTSETPKPLPRGLDHTKVILNFVGKIGSGPIGVPGLKTAAETVIKVIDIAQVRKLWMINFSVDVRAAESGKE